MTNLCTLARTAPFRRRERKAPGPIPLTDALEVAVLIDGQWLEDTVQQQHRGLTCSGHGSCLLKGRYTGSKSDEWPPHCTIEWLATMHDWGEKPQQ